MTTVQDLPQVKGVKNIPLEEQFTSGHRTCQGCESALVMRLMSKAAGPRTIARGRGSTGPRRRRCSAALGRSAGAM